MLYYLMVLGMVPIGAVPVINMTQGVTPISHKIYQLHMLIFYICLVVGILTFAVIIYSLIKHRRSKGAKPAKFSGNLWIELVWTIIPLVILIGMVYPAAKVLLEMEDTSEATINIKVTGLQWKWKYEYLDDNLSFYSSLSTPQDQIQGIEPKGEHYLLEVDHPIVVPIHEKIRFLFTSQDVIHSWWVPDLGVKTDAMPGYITDAWAYIEKPGVYRGQCSELCGMMHGFMPIVLIAETRENYDKWLANNGQFIKKPGIAVDGEDAQGVSLPKEEIDFSNLDAVKGKGLSVYKANCTACHKDNGEGMPPVFPSFVGSGVVTGQIKEHIKILLLGVAGKAMQSYADQLTDEEIAAVITYERNAWGNDDHNRYGSLAGGIVTPEDVRQMRQELGLK